MSRWLELPTHEAVRFCSVYGRQTLVVIVALLLVGSLREDYSGSAKQREINYGLLVEAALLIHLRQRSQIVMIKDHMIIRIWWVLTYQAAVVRHAHFTCIVVRVTAFSWRICVRN